MKKTIKSKEKIDAFYCYNAKVPIWEPCLPVGVKERVSSFTEAQEIMHSFSAVLRPLDAIFWVDEGDIQQPKLHYLLRLAIKREIRSLTVPALSHILRAGYSLPELFEFFDSHEVIFRSIEEHLDTSTPISRFKRLYDADRPIKMEMFSKELIACEKEFKAFVVKHIDPHQRFKSQEAWDSFHEIDAEETQPGLKRKTSSRRKNTKT